jgi:zinc transporter ZupT
MMAIVKCKDCSNEISKSAFFCPRCGCSGQKLLVLLYSVVIGQSLIVGALIGYWIGTFLA